MAKQQQKASGKNEASKTAAVAQPRFSLNVKLAFLLGLIAFCVYVNTLKNNFAMDDYTMIIKNSIVTKGAKAIPELFTTPHSMGYGAIPNDEYRPLPMALFSVEYQLFEVNAMPYHFINILLFMGCVIALFFFLDRLFEGTKTAAVFVACLLFALHPIHTEVVANIKSGDELLSFLFAFLSLYVFLSYSRMGKAKDLLLGGLYLFLSFLSKETSFTFLALLPVILFCFREGQRRRGVQALVAAGIAGAVFLVIRFTVLNYYHANHIGQMDVVENALAKHGLSMESRIATAILIMGYYVKLLFVPYPLVCDYAFNTIPFTHFSDVRVLLTIAIYAALVVFAIRRFVKDRKDPYAFAVAVFLLTISIVSNIPFLIKSTMGERFLFYPSVGFCLAIALLAEQLMKKAGKAGWDAMKDKRILYALTPICLLYACITINRNADWLDNYTIYSTDLPKVPEDCRLNYFVGYQVQAMSYNEPNPAIRENMLRDVVKYYRKALDINPDYPDAIADLGATYFSMKKFDSAEVYDLMVLQYIPAAVVTRNNLMGVYLTSGQFRKAISLGTESMRLIPGNVNEYADLGSAYLSLKKYDSTLQCLKKGSAIDPTFFGINAVAAFLYNELGNRDSVNKYEALAQKSNPSFVIKR